MNAKCQFASPESKLLAGRQPFQSATCFVAAEAAKQEKLPAAQKKTTPLSI